MEEARLAHTVETVELEMDDWEDWSYSVKNYVALFKTDILEVMERSERGERPITDQDVAGLVTDPDDTRLL